MSLEEKKQGLQKSAQALFQKGMIRKVLSSLSFVALDMGCHPRSCIINMVVGLDKSLTLVISNSENDETQDVTHTAEEMRDDNPLFEELVNDLIEIIQDVAKFWETEQTNVKFVAWTDGDDIGAKMCPILGFPPDEILKLTQYAN